jgi:hypothetical protein
VRLRRDREQLQRLRAASSAPSSPASVDPAALAAAIAGALAQVMTPPAAPSRAAYAAVPETLDEMSARGARPAPEARPATRREATDAAVEEAQAPDRPTDNTRILAFGCVHLPYHHPDALSFLRALRDDVEPTRVVCLGDEIDWQALSAFVRDPDLASAGHELREARRAALELHDLFPIVDVLHSNHAARPRRVARGAGLPRGVMACPGDILFGERIEDGRFVRPKGRGLGWRWHHELTLDLRTGPCVFAHDLGTNLQRIALEEGVSVVQADHHRLAGVEWIATRLGQRFAAASGCLINPRSPAFAYDRAGAKRPMLGALVIYDGVPSFVPMLLDKHGRWIGRL